MIKISLIFKCYTRFLGAKRKFYNKPRSFETRPNKHSRAGSEKLCITIEVVECSPSVLLWTGEERPKKKSLSVFKVERRMISGEWFDAKISFYRINISIIAGNTQYNNEDVGNLEVENILNIISLQKNAFIYTAVGKILKLPNEESRGVLFFLHLT